MARLPDDLNPKKDSSGSQFYIALQDLPDLDGDYTVFGNVIEGFDLIAKIGKVQTGPGNKPITPVIITKATTSDK
jgi:cyclophilin family peptidyl-prolyl cis-trans isomerase